MTDTYASPRVRGLEAEKRALEKQAERMAADLQDLREQITKKQRQIVDEIVYERERR